MAGQDKETPDPRAHICKEVREFIMHHTEVKVRCMLGSHGAPSAHRAVLTEDITVSWPNTAPDTRRVGGQLR